MNKIIFFVYISICITACQTFADEVQNGKQVSSAPEMASTPVKNADEKSSQNKADLAKQLKMRQIRTLDPAVFTMIRPYTLDRSPVRLPPTQVLD